MLVSPATDVFIGLGSNLLDPEQQLRSAIAALKKLPQSDYIVGSQFYRSKPLDNSEQPDYLNAVVWLRTSCSADDLLSELLRIEKQQGRVRDASSPHWGPRTLDLDILVYGDQKIDKPHLKVPHPGIPERAFVLYPLFEIAPDLVIPGLGELRLLLQQCPQDGLKRI